MAISAQNSILEGCPVFIERLRSNPKLSQRLKELMQPGLREALQVIQELYDALYAQNAAA